MSRIGYVLAAMLAIAAPAAAETDAEVLYAEGERRYNVGEYDAAVDAFKRAYLISNEASLLYNIAQAYRKKGACVDALEFYRSYLRQKPDASDRASIEKMIDELDPCPVAPAPAPVVVLRPPAVVREEAGPSRGQVTLGIGGVSLLVAGGVTLGITIAQYNTLKEECPCPRERWTTWRNAELASYVALGVGAAALGTAVTWWILQRDSKRTNATALRLVPSTNSLSLVGTF